jgi:hypothetical protein
MVCLKDSMTCKSEKDLGGGECWTSGNCDTGYTCTGVNVCPCDADCDMEDSPGTCKKAGIPIAVCKTLDPNSFGVCAAIIGVVFDGEKCVEASGCDCGNQCSYVFKTMLACEISCKVGSTDLCADFEQPGCSKKGCDEGMICDITVGCVPSTCSCNPKNGDIKCTADCMGGTCVPKDDQKCCEDDKGCPGDFVCAKGVCKKNSLPYCWTDAQCKEGTTCEMEQVCPCGENCIIPDKYGKCSKMGIPLPTSCMALKQGSFGACATVLGWGWTGSKCDHFSGCQCEPLCKQFYDTELDCMKECSKPIPSPTPQE